MNIEKEMAGKTAQEIRDEIERQTREVEVKRKHADALEAYMKNKFGELAWAKQKKAAEARDGKH